MPDPASTFAGWSGSGCTAKQIDCAVTMNSDAAVTATFNQIPGLETLTVISAGVGYSHVGSVPAGIDCRNDLGAGSFGTCVAAFSTGSTVTLTASSGLGETFNGWSGAGCSGTGTCSVVMTSDETVTATSTEFPDFSVSISQPLSPNPISAGQSSSGGVQLSQGFLSFFGTVNMSCSVQPLPQFAPQCSVSPSAVTLGGQPLTLTVTTTAATAAMRSPFRGSSLLYAVCLPLLGLVLFAGAFSPARNRSRLLGILLCGIVLTTAISQSACGGGSNGGSHGGSSGTPPGTYTITVTGTSGSLQHTTSVSLTVQ